MDELLLKIFAQAGPLVILAGLFLYFGYRIETRRGEAMDRLSESLRALADKLGSRPCLWQESQQELLSRFEHLVERVSEAVVVRVNGLEKTG